MKKINIYEKLDKNIWEEMIPVYRPFLPPSSLKYAHEALDSGWVSSNGKYIQLATDKLQQLLNVKYVQLLNNGTAACHLLAKSLQFKHNINEIIVPDNVYVAAINSFLFDRNFTLRSIPSDINTWNIDLAELDAAITKHPKAAVLIVHNISNVINVPALKRKYPNTVFVEDNCEGFLGTYENKQTGTESFASAISFYANKNATSGEGGAFLTNDEDIYNSIKCIQGQGQSSKRFVHNRLGYNYRMTNVQAALLLGQLEILPTIMQMKNDVFSIYRDHLKDREDILMQTIDPNTTPANWMFGVRIPKQGTRIVEQGKYEQAEKFFIDRNIEIRPMFYSIQEHEYLTHSNIYFSDDKVARLLNKQCLILPSYPELTQEEQKHILKTLDEYVLQIVPEESW